MIRKYLLLVSALVLMLTNMHAQQIIAHRGYWKTDGSAQNSIASLMKADAIGIFGSEVDVWLSSDDVPMINHDAEVTLNGKKLSVQDTPFATLRKVTLANGEILPTMEEYLDAFARCKNVKLIIEFKVHNSKEKENLLAEKVIGMVRQRGLQEKVEYISFGAHFVQQVKSMNPQAPVYYLNGDLSPQVLATMGLSGFDYHFNVLYKRPEWVRKAHELGQKVNVWTLNKPEDIRKMIDLKVDFITTDEPLLVKEILQKK
ncbi:MAG: glycerophosphodiester phosphodiesterase [Porphyromonadaceae bacterium]|nr:glycerophosphodiester phosphodiesterase [Porphyromonadaceae bacterium]